jgi:uncharacterized Fe-S cluster-containing MiaB family protein
MINYQRKKYTDPKLWIISLIVSQNHHKKSKNKETILDKSKNREKG